MREGWGEKVFGEPGLEPVVTPRCAFRLEPRSATHRVPAPLVRRPLHNWGMSDTVTLTMDQYRMVIAMQYLTAAEAIFAGLQRQQGANSFHFVVTLRSFIEYTRRGIWFLVWATDADLLKAGKATFQRPSSPPLLTMDALINEALGEGKVSHLKRKIPGINEPFIDCLHALTHGNPISARMLAIGLETLFDTAGLFGRAEVDLGVFRVLLYRRTLGQSFDSIWKILIPIHNEPATMKANVLIAAQQLRQSGKVPAVGTASDSTEPPDHTA
jgi:hypothetical protein